MIIADSLRPLKIQLALWWTSEIAKPAPIYIGAILKNHHEIFDGDVEAIPIPDDAPDEIARAKLQSEDKLLEFVGKKSRIDLYVKEGFDFGSAVRIDISELSKILISICDFHRVTEIRKLGVIISRRAELENASSEFISRFCSDDAQKTSLRRSDVFEMHNLKKYVLPQTEQISINSWVRCVATNSQITVHHDVNSTAESADRFIRTDEIASFFRAAQAESLNTMKTYFGEN